MMFDAQADGSDLLAHAFVAAWNAHLPAGFEALFTEDAIWVPVAESRLLGRQAIVDDLAEIHADWAAETTMAAADVEARAVASDVSVIVFHALYVDENGVPFPGVDRAMMLVASKASGEWRIAAGQLTKQS
ncbi:MAG: SgcJ/EcaC family oxidoreductase [Candidatus Limnocylindrales bacterium]